MRAGQLLWTDNVTVKWSPFNCCIVGFSDDGKPWVSENFR